MESLLKNPNRFSFKYLFLYGLSILFIIGLFIPTPYYLYQPGSAEELTSKVSVENGHKNEKGKFYLTTVLSIKASNIYYLVYGYFASHTEIKKEEEVHGDLSDHEYNQLLKHMMTTSQQDAIVSSLKAAGEPVTIHPDGVFVANIIPHSKAKKVLEVGDIIVSIDGKTVQKAADFKTYLNQKKKVGDIVTVDFKHAGKKRTKKIELIQLDSKAKTIGLGIYPEDEISIDTKRKITFHTEDIGGPSAGLMFSLEILSQILPDDIKKGYKVAGTGTIDLDGNVGQIGGIRDKIVAAHNQNVDIFLCPKDIAKDDTNEKELKDEAKKLGYTSIKIVPVKTLVEAENYLKSLPPKK